jgi:hypothetical protein
VSDINYLSINENFPVPGEDNDTQIFRDNFDTIKQSLRTAKDEITDLQDNSARTDLDNDFNNKLIQRSVFLKSYEKKLDGNLVEGNVREIDFEYGHYQIWKFTQDTSIQFTNFPETIDAVGKVTLELYSNNTSPKTLSFLTSGGTVIKKSSNWPASVIVDSVSDPVIIEVWKHSQQLVFLNYLGKFTS